jgi:hypothetical protein
MPIRWRPEAGFLLALASGRLPFRWRGGDRMMLLRRRPREVYRVYSEDEYLDGAGAEVGAGLEVAAVGTWPPAAEPARKAAGERRLRRVAGVAMLAGALGAVGGLVVMTSSWTNRGAGRRPGSLVAAVRSPAVVGSSAVSTRPTLAGPSAATRSRGARAGWRHGMADTHAPTHLSAGPHGSDAHPPGRVRRGYGPAPQSSEAGVKRGGGVAIIVDYVPRSPSAGAPATAAAGETTATDVSPSAATSRPVAGKQAEFGFER